MSKKSVENQIGKELSKLIAVVIVDLLNAVVVMVFWNWVAVDVLQLPNIGYWQALGLFTLCRMLFTRPVLEVRIKE